MRKNLSVLTAAALAGLLSGAILGAVGAAGQDARVRECGIGGTVQSALDIARARDIWQNLPAMKRAPELEGNNAPASVVVYEGEVSAVVLGPAGVQCDRATNAVCVITDEGPIVYVNVPRSGFQPPGQ